MALARLALRNLQQKVNGSSSLTNKWMSNNNNINNRVLRFASAATGGGGDKGKSEGTQAAVSKGFVNNERTLKQHMDRFWENRKVAGIKGMVVPGTAMVVDTKSELKDGALRLTLTIQMNIAFSDKESGNDNDDNGYRSSSSYGNDNNTKLVLDDLNDINAEWNDGVLTCATIGHPNDNEYWSLSSLGSYNNTSLVLDDPMVLPNDANKVKDSTKEGFGEGGLVMRVSYIVEVDLRFKNDQWEWM